MQLPSVIGLYSPAPGCGKSTVARMICDATSVHCVVPFADPLKRIARELLMAAGYDIHAAQQYVRVDKERPLELLPGAPTARHLMQTLGTDWGRHMVHPELWVELWKARAKQFEFVTADDCRFANEAAAIRDLGGEVWCITRPGREDTTGHVSEGGLDGFEFDRVIVNDGTVEDLRGMINDLP